MCSSEGSCGESNMLGYLLSVSVLVVRTVMALSCWGGDLGSSVYELMGEIP